LYDVTVDCTDTQTSSKVNAIEATTKHNESRRVWLLDLP
jgi:hypothetical protein